MLHHQVNTQDDVTIHVVEAGNPSGRAILFVRRPSPADREPPPPRGFSLRGCDHGEIRQRVAVRRS